MRPGSYCALVGFVLFLGGCNAGESDSAPVSEQHPGMAALIHCGMQEPELDLNGFDIVGTGGTHDVTIVNLQYSGTVTFYGFSGDEVKLLASDEPTVHDPNETTWPAIAFPSSDGSEKPDIEVMFPEDCEGLIQIVADGVPTHAIESPSPSRRILEVPAQPPFPGTARVLEPARLDGILFNGVPIRMRDDCGEGCGHFLNPMFGEHDLDGHHGHTHAGAYHYHGDPKILYDDSGISDATIIGIAADGYPIFGPWIAENGIKRKVTSSYSLRSGARTEAEGGGFYDGTYVDDYEYIHGLGDLDECNGARLGDIYGYFVTEEFPYVMNCLRADPDPSFDL